MTEDKALATTWTTYDAERHVTHRCRRMQDHTSKPFVPVPCENCYAVESVWRAIPYEPNSRSKVTAHIGS